MFTSVGSADFKQHINLSSYAYSIIQNDMQSFMEKPSLSGFLNKVIEEYRDFANASVSVALTRQKDTLSHTLENLKDSPDKSIIMDTLIKQYQHELQEQIASYPKGVYVKFRLNKKNFSSLFEEECPESEYYDSQGKYIKAIIEEYVRKTPLERETVFYSGRLSFIQSCIKSGLLLKVTTRKKWVYEVKPYSIEIDPSGLYHYLVGIATSPARPEIAPQISSFRISLLSDVNSRPKNYKSGKVTQREAEEIKNQLQKKGVQFLLSNQEEIAVKLDDISQKMFSSQLHLRPHPDTVDEDGIYHFTCTQHQISYYFFKFGAHAEIVSPKSLRERFAQQYIEAVRLYKEYSKLT